MNEDKKIVGGSDATQGEVGEFLDIRLLNSGEITIEVKVRPFEELRLGDRFLRILREKGAKVYRVWCKASDSLAKEDNCFNWEKVGASEFVLRVK